VVTARRFAFSNIAWTPHDDPRVFALLRQHGITGIEVAPTAVWPGWDGSSTAAASDYRAFLSDQGFAVPALQALLYARPEARLFDDHGEAQLLTHLAHVAAIAGALGAGVAVLGAPRQRDCGTRAWDEAVEHAAPVLRQAAGLFADQGSCLCIEPNPRRYGCNFVCTAQQGAELVSAVGHPGFGLHLDAAALHLEGDRLHSVLPQVLPILRHFHVSEPDLGDFRAPQAPHRENLRDLDAHGYPGWCSVEMRRPQGELATTGPWALLGTVGAQ
jgi:D-psicose/D-tagatose/L-ribulose 3-epimerase